MATTTKNPSLKTDKERGLSTDNLVAGVNSGSNPVSLSVAGAGSAPGPASGSSAKPAGKFKEVLSIASTALPIAGAIGTLGVWLTANFYVGDVQLVLDRAFNTLEVRVSDKKGSEGVFHTPHFQLMPGRYHIEVTVDGQYKQHADVQTNFHHNSNIAIHVPTGQVSASSVVTAPGVPAIAPAPAAFSSAAGAQGYSRATSSPTAAAPAAPGEASNLAPAAEAGSSPMAMGSDNSDSSKNTPTRKRWWQFWKKAKSDH